MGDPELQKRLMAEVEPVTNAMGFAVVELAVGGKRHQTQVHLTVFRPDGVGIEDCAAISRNVHPRLELIAGLGSATLEVSSPGLDRTLKNPREYSIFKGRRVQVLLEGESEWTGARILDTSAEGVTLETAGQPRNVLFTGIRRAKLDDTEEVGE